MRRLPVGMRKVTKEEFIQSFLEWYDQDEYVKPNEGLREFSHWNKSETEEETVYRPNSRW